MSAPDAAFRAEPAPRAGFVAGIAATARRELAAYFDSSIAYVALVVGLVSATTLYMNEFFLTGRLDMTPFFESLSWISILLACAISMRAWSEDLRTRTFELWMSLPLSPLEIVLGKFAAALALYAVFLAGTLPIVVMLCYLGDPDLGRIAAGYAGAFAMGAAFLAVGMLCSSLTSDQIVAFLSSAAVLGFLVFSGEERVVAVLDGMAPSIGLGSRIADWLSALPHYETFVRGAIAPASIAYFALLLAASLYLNTWVVTRHRT